MDWFTSLEQRRREVLFVIFLLLIATLAVTAMRDPVDYDSFWHLRTGQDWVESNLSPWHDHYSYTFDGADIRSPPVFFDLGLFGMVQWLGLETGFKVLVFACMLLVLVLTALWLRHINAPVLVYCLVLPMLVALLQMRATARPELLSYAFSVLALMFYDRAKTGLTAKTVLPIALLMLAWTNYHSSILGYVIFFGLFLDHGIQQLSERVSLGQWSRWLAWGGVVAGVGFLNPGYVHPLVSMLAFPAEWKTLIQEYQSPLMFKNVPPVYILALLAIGTLLLLVRQRRWGYLVVMGVLLFHAMSMARVVTPAGIVILCIFAHALSSTDLKSTVAQASRRRQKQMGAAALLVFLVPLLNDVITARAFVQVNRTLGGFFPVQMVQYMQDAGKHGRIFNAYELGGYLIYHLAPESKVFIDGRTEILYPVEHYQRHLSAMNSAEAMRSEIAAYDINLAILRSTADNAKLMAQAGPLQLDYADVKYFLYSRDDAQFPVAGLLWGQPYCWNSSMAGQVAEEQLKAIMDLPPTSPLAPFLQLVTDYANAEDPGGFLNGTSASASWPDPSKRFAGYQAIRNRMYDLARTHFAAVEAREPKDYLAEALAALRGGEPTEAENLLDTALHIQWGSLDFIDLVILEGLLGEIQATGPLKKFEPEYLDNLATQVGEFSLFASGKQVTVETFCADPEE